jgi:hypothetical protein
LLAAPLSARTPEQSEMLYHDIGSQLFCVCGGCREGLLVCSMNNCSAKVVQRDFLHELVKDDSLDSAAIKAAMAKRFGPGVLQVPEQSSLYPILGIAGLLLAAAFGFGFWAVSRRATGKIAARLSSPKSGATAQ